ncbi:MAG: NUDIX hydrolase N-terminal domain-containing protein [Caldilineaceae bacterium]|nr:NUDIX hydrolase N-terminal domain-containing protein [Caldilineaceae bacterium]
MSLEMQLIRLADELRALSNAGLRFTQDPYQIERYHRILEISAELTSAVNDHGPAELRRLFLEDLHYMTPYTVVDTAIFDEDGRILLIQRADNSRWALPGGACEVGETAATGAAREAWEETGCVVEIDQLIGLFDSRVSNEQTLHHLYIFLFSAHLVSGFPRITRETLDIRWFAPAEIPWTHLSGNHGTRIRHAFLWRSDPAIPIFFERDPWQPRPTFQH